jgi:hypothetical protein
MRFLRIAASLRRRNVLMKAKYTTLSTKGQIMIPAENPRADETIGRH